MDMSRRAIVSVAVLVAIVMGGIWFSESLSKGQKMVAEPQQFSVVASFYPLSYLASTIGGGAVSVINITPAGAEPHDFEPSPREMLVIGEADLFLYNGGGFEPWVTKWRSGGFQYPARILDMMAALKGKGAEFIETGGEIDPHIWLDPLLMSKEAQIIRDAFVSLDPEHAAVYHENTERLVAALAELDASFSEGLATCEKDRIVVSHGAFSYLARAYGINVTSIAGMSPDEDPSPRDLARILDVMRANGVEYVFFETTASPKLSETLAREVGGKTSVLNPLEGLTPSQVRSGEDYVSVMRSNLNNIRRALVCQ